MIEVGLFAEDEGHRSLAAGRDSFLEGLVVAIDANSDGVAARRQWIEGLIRNSYAGSLVTAIPDPHVERWYLAEPYAVSASIGQRYCAEVPSTLPKGESYKHVLRSAFLQGGVDPPGGRAGVWRGDCPDHGLPNRLATARAGAVPLRSARGSPECPGRRRPHLTSRSSRCSMSRSFSNRGARRSG